MKIVRGVLKGLPVVPHQAYNDWVTLNVDPAWEPKTKEERLLAKQGRSILNAAVYPPSALEMTPKEWAVLLKMSNETLGREFVYNPETGLSKKLPYKKKGKK